MPKNNLQKFSIKNTWLTMTNKRLQLKNTMNLTVSSFRPILSSYYFPLLSYLIKITKNWAEPFAASGVMWIEIALFLVINQDQSHKWSPAELRASKATCCRKPERKNSQSRPFLESSLNADFSLTSYLLNLFSWELGPNNLHFKSTM